MMFQQTDEQRAFQRWMSHDFLEAERGIAKWWRRSLTSIDLDGMAKAVMDEIGPHWRKPKNLKDAREMADIIIDHTDPEWLLGFRRRLIFLRVPEVKELVAMNDWIGRRRPPLIDEQLPYFIFMLSINIFFCLVLPTQLLKNVKPSHHIDLALSLLPAVLLCVHLQGQLPCSRSSRCSSTRPRPSSTALT